MNHSNKITFKDLIPLFSMFALCIGFVIVRQVLFGWCMYGAIMDFMAAFFLSFGALKIINLKGFVTAYEKYDLVTKLIPAYGYVYPFIEVTLGIAYLFAFVPFLTSFITFILMSVSVIGVLNAMIFQSERLMCACLGDLLKVPLTYVTLFEDLLMAGIALFMMYVYW